MNSVVKNWTVAEGEAFKRAREDESDRAPGKKQPARFPLARFHESNRY